MAPRDIFDNPNNFGRHNQADTSKPAGWTDATYAAAVLQHRAAVTVLFRLEQRQPMTEQRWAEHADLLDTTGSTLRRKLYGSAAATLTDLASWALLFGIDTWPTIDSAAELLPASSDESAA